MLTRYTCSPRSPCLQNVMLRPLSQEHVIFLACVASVTVLGCLAGRCLVMSAPTDALTEERDSDSTRCITGVRVILFCGVVINFFPDLMIVTENLWSISLLNNAFACITIVRILLGGECRPRSRPFAAKLKSQPLAATRHLQQRVACTVVASAAARL